MVPMNYRFVARSAGLSPCEHFILTLHRGRERRITVREADSALASAHALPPDPHIPIQGDVVADICVPARSILCITRRRRSHDRRVGVTRYDTASREMVIPKGIEAVIDWLPNGFARPAEMCTAAPYRRLAFNYSSCIVIRLVYVRTSRF